MKDFFKIFFFLSTLLIVFLMGRNYGEERFKQSEEYKKSLSLQTELNFVRSELENSKIKLQNIIDRAEQKKTEDLLAQILNVFLVDLGLRIQNKENLLKNTKTLTASNDTENKDSRLQEKNSMIVEAEKENKGQQQKNKPQRWKRISDQEYKNLENKLLKSKDNTELTRTLNRLRIQNIEAYLENAETIQESSIHELIGLYVGPVFDINSKRYGSLSYKLMQTENNDVDQFKLSGEISFNSELHGAQKYNFDIRSFGKVIYGYRSILIQTSSNKYFQIYKLGKTNKLAGNYYEKLPNGTTSLIGQFVLNRADQFN